MANTRSRRSRARSRQPRGTGTEGDTELGALWGTGSGMSHATRVFPSRGARKLQHGSRVSLARHVDGIEVSRAPAHINAKERYRPRPRERTGRRMGRPRCLDTLFCEVYRSLPVIICPVIRPPRLVIGPPTCRPGRWMNLGGTRTGLRGINNKV